MNKTWLALTLFWGAILAIQLYRREAWSYGGPQSFKEHPNWAVALIGMQVIVFLLLCSMVFFEPDATAVP